MPSLALPAAPTPHTHAHAHLHRAAFPLLSNNHPNRPWLPPPCSAFCSYAVDGLPAGLKQTRILASSAAFWAPVMRHMWWWLGIRPVSRKCFATLLGKGRCAGAGCREGWCCTGMPACGGGKQAANAAAQLHALQRQLQCCRPHCLPCCLPCLLCAGRWRCAPEASRRRVQQVAFAAACRWLELLPWQLCIAAGARHDQHAVVACTACCDCLLHMPTRAFDQPCLLSTLCLLCLLCLQVLFMERGKEVAYLRKRHGFVRCGEQMQQASQGLPCSRCEHCAVTA